MLCYVQHNRRRKYPAEVEGRHASFKPVVVSVDGVLGHTSWVTKWERSHAEVMGWVSCQNGFCSPTCYIPLSAWVQSEMEKWAWHGWLGVSSSFFSMMQKHHFYFNHSVKKALEFMIRLFNFLNSQHINCSGLEIDTCR